MAKSRSSLKEEVRRWGEQRNPPVLSNKVRLMTSSLTPAAQAAVAVLGDLSPGGARMVGSRSHRVSH